MGTPGGTIPGQVGRRTVSTDVRLGTAGLLLKLIGVWLMRSGRSLCTKFGQDSDFEATETLPDATSAPQVPRTTLGALSAALNARPDSRRALRHLYMVEQTVEQCGWRLELLPLAVLQKASRELRVLMGGSLTDPGLERVRERLQAQVNRIDLQHYIAKSAPITRWQRSELDADDGEVWFGEDMPTQPMGLVDVPLEAVMAHVPST